MVVQLKGTVGWANGFMFAHAAPGTLERVRGSANGGQEP